MKSLRSFEAAMLRVEGTIAVALVVLMLVLAGYNVVYRNVLVPLQRHWAHSGPKVTALTPSPAPTADAPAADAPPRDAAAPTRKAEPSAAEGFAGDWGEGGEPEPEPEPAAKADPKPAPKPEAKDDAGDFGGDWGEDDGAPAPEPGTAEPGAAEGFAGDWGEGGAATPPTVAAGATAAAPDEADDFGDEADSDPFANLPDIDVKGGPAAAPNDPDEGGPPPPGSFAANMVEFIDAVKLDWIDVVLRQLVILVSFFGAMMATRTGKHINVDALSKLVPPAGRRALAVVTNALAVAVCVVFARAGAELVAIGREHPSPLTSWADEWVFQLMFPFGFGLVAFHFGVRLLEAVTGAAPASADPAASAEPTTASKGEG